MVFSGKMFFALDEALTFRYLDEKALAENPILWNSSLFMDQRGLFWFGHREGFEMIEVQESRFKQFLKNEGGDPFPARGVAEHGEFLFVNSIRTGGFINTRTGELWSYSDAYPRFDNNKCFPMVKTSNGELWVANDRLYQLDEQGKWIEEISIHPYKSKKIWSFFQDASQTFWIGAGRDTIFYFNASEHEKPQPLLQYNGFDALLNTEKWHFLEDKHGIWIAAQNGLYLLDKQKGIIARYGEQEQGDRFLPANQFFYIFKNDSDRLWLATGDGGLMQLELDAQGKAKIIKHLTRANGLPSNELYAIFEDDFKHFGISSANGLIQYNPLDGEINVYFEEQGITNKEFNRLSSFQSDTGTIYFGGLNGVTAFQPGHFYNQKPYDAPLKASNIKLFSGKEDRLMDLTEMALNGTSIQFFPGDKYMIFNFSLQNYFHAERVKYQYRIEGLGNEWETLNTNVFQLSGLPYGEFTLHVRAGGQGNQLSINELRLGIEVLKPFYLTTWFLIGLALALVGAVWLWYSLRIRSYRKRQVQLEKIVAERTEKIRQDKLFIEKQADQLKEMDEIKSRFFANISHELRTPLTMILGPLESVLNRNQLKQRDSVLLQMMQQNGRKLLRRINELLDLSSLDSKKLKVAQSPVRLYAFTRQLLAAFESGANLKNIQLTLDYHLDTAIQALLDADKVEKIVSNFLSNAIKFTPKEGHIHVTLSQQSGYLQISVRDTGMGIPEGEVEKVFDRFYQVRGSDQASGSGIGLSLSRELAELMEGKVWAESAEGQGSTFYLQLPLRETFETISPDEEAAPVAKPIALENTVQSGQDRILVVEDNPSLLKFIRILLEGYQVLTAENGKVALDILADCKQKQQTVNLIISDIMMPVMDGFELLKVLKNHEDYLHIPVVMLTARQNLESKLDALRIGVDDYMVKPFQEAELLASVSNLIKNSRGRTNAEVTQANIPSKQTKSPETQTTPSVSAADLKWLSEVERHILKNIGNTQFSISQLADELAMSTRRFQQKIKQISGLTPKEYQREIQLEQARRVLESGSVQSVSEISYKIGFKDAHYFSSLFQKRYGKKPSEYL